MFKFVFCIGGLEVALPHHGLGDDLVDSGLEGYVELGSAVLGHELIVAIHEVFKSVLLLGQPLEESDQLCIGDLLAVLRSGQSIKEVSGELHIDRCHHLVGIVFYPLQVDPLAYVTASHDVYIKPQKGEAFRLPPSFGNQTNAGLSVLGAGFLYFFSLQLEQLVEVLCRLGKLLLLLLSKLVHLLVLLEPIEVIMDISC